MICTPTGRPAADSRPCSRTTHGRKREVALLHKSLVRHGFAAVEPRLGEVARALRMSRWQTIAKVSLPSATPDILAGLRLGLTVSLILAVVCEMIAGLDGLGQWVLLAARSYKSADIFAGVALLGVIGLVANATLSLVEARALRWRTSGRG